MGWIRLGKTLTPTLLLYTLLFFLQTGINANVFGLREKNCEATKSCFITAAMCNSVPKQIDHSIVIVGYGTDPVHGDYWNVKNSWSKAFANDGFIRVARGVNCGDIDCALLKEATVFYTPDTHPPLTTSHHISLLPLIHSRLWQCIYIRQCVVLLRVKPM